MSKQKPNTVEDLTFDSANVRVHGDKNKKVIAGSLKQFGAGRSILADADGVIRAGNGTAEAWKQSGGKIRIVESDGKELIVVKRTDLRGADAVAYAIADNRASELAEWSDDLGDVLSEIDESVLDAIGFDIDDVEYMNADDAERETASEAGGFRKSKEDYENQTIKAMNLFFDEEDYAIVADFLNKKMEALGLENYAAVLLEIANANG